jgi:hypothetical protein
MTGAMRTMKLTRCLKPISRAWAENDVGWQKTR